MVCTSSVDALVSVVLTARVTTSTQDTVGARKGDTLSLSFNVDPSWVHREIYGATYPRGWFDLSVISADETWL